MQINNMFLVKFDEDKQNFLPKYNEGRPEWFDDLLFSSSIIRYDEVDENWYFRNSVKIEEGNYIVQDTKGNIHLFK